MHSDNLIRAKVSLRREWMYENFFGWKGLLTSTLPPGKTVNVKEFIQKMEELQLLLDKLNTEMKEYEKNILIGNVDIQTNSLP